MIYEFPENFNKLDDITKSIILEDYRDSLIEEGCSEKEADMYVEMVEFELNDEL